MFKILKAYSVIYCNPFVSMYSVMICLHYPTLRPMQISINLHRSQWESVLVFISVWYELLHTILYNPFSYRTQYHSRCRTVWTNHCIEIMFVSYTNIACILCSWIATGYTTWTFRRTGSGRAARTGSDTSTSNWWDSLRQQQVRSSL